MKKILLVGGGGHCKSVADAILRNKEYDEIGIVDLQMTEPMFGAIPVVGTDEDLSRLFSEGWIYAFVTMGSITNTRSRRRLFENLVNVGFSIPNIIDISAHVSPNAEIGKGVFVGKNAVINAGSIIKDAVIVNTGAIVEHDCSIDEFSHISTGATLCGGVIIGHDTHVGANSVIKQYTRVGSNTIIGMGSVVIHDIGDNMKIVGNPANPIAD